MADNIPKKKVTKRTIETIEAIETIENPAFVRDNPKNEQSPLVGGSRSFRGGSVFGDVSFIDHPYLTRIKIFLISSFKFLYLWREVATNKDTYLFMN